MTDEDGRRYEISIRIKGLGRESTVGYTDMSINNELGID